MLENIFTEGKIGGKNLDSDKSTHTQAALRDCLHFPKDHLVNCDILLSNPE